MNLNNLEEYDNSPRKYEVNKYVKITNEDEQFCKERKLKPIYRITFKKNFNWFHIVFLVLILLIVIGSIIVSIIH